MFSYLRYFSAISLVVIIVASYFLGAYFKSVASEDLRRLVEKNNEVLAQGYINSTWKAHHNVLVRLWRIDVSKWKLYREFRDFSEDTLGYFEEMPVSVLNIYTPAGDLILSTEPAKDSAVITEEELGVFQAAQQGTSQSRILTDVDYFLPNGEIANGTFIQTFVPIRSDYFVPILAGDQEDKVEAIIELHFNITPQWEKLWSFQILSTGGIVMLFLVLISILFVSSRKAEGIIAKQHEVNLELTAAAASAEAENRDKSQFLANISHELRTPLNAIIGFSEILKNEAMAKMEYQYQEYMRDIHNSGVHLLSLINDILDFSKAEAGKLEVNISETDGVKLIKNSMRLVIPRAEEAQVTLVEELPKKHFTLQTDAKKLKQVLLNLLSNSVKFTPSGGEVRVMARHNIAEDTIIIEVKDTGIGISPKDISKVMQPFGQVDSKLSRKYEGTGLGLPLSKKFVEILGGTFHITSEEGKGTTITITLPRLFSREGPEVRHDN